jgi:citrate/tricarballylate utilization protein
MHAIERAGTRGDVVHASSALAEADRLMTVCNSCRYCEGLCAVFPAMEMRRTFGDGDLKYLANLCHGCGACYYDCQFAPPHEFDVNVPRNLAQVRAESYQAYAWPRVFAGVFARNGLWLSLIAALSVAAFILGFVAYHDRAVVFGVHTGPGAFYRLMPHNAMVAIFGAAFLYAIVASAMGMRAFWRSIAALPSRHEPVPLLQAMRDAGTLRYLDGGGVGCHNEDEHPTDRRRLYHHLTFYGFLLCFASTSVATLYHYALQRVAPYPWYDLPVVLGTLGGIGLVIGPLGLLAAHWRRDDELRDAPRFGMDVGFILMLLLTSLTGLALLVLRETAAMGILLALHLGVVFALFLTMPYGKFVHGLYRFLALVRYAQERRAQLGGGTPAVATTGQGGTRP